LDSGTGISANNYYAYIRYPSGRGKHVGDNMIFPGYFGFESPGFDPKPLVLRCWQMAHFPKAKEHSWFRESINHLESYITERGTYIFPSEYLTEVSDRGNGFMDCAWDWVKTVVLQIGESWNPRSGCLLSGY